MKLGAKDLSKLKKPLFKDYLHHVKKYAQPSHKSSVAEIPKMSADPPHIEKIASHYYCEKNELLSLK